MTRFPRHLGQSHEGDAGIERVPLWGHMSSILFGDTMVPNVE